MSGSRARGVAAGLGAVDVTSQATDGTEAATGEILASVDDMGITSIGMASATDALADYVAGFDLVAMGAALGDELAATLLATSRDKDQIVLDRGDLAGVLGAAAQRGAARFLSCAVLDMQLGDGVTLDRVMATLRAALDLLCTPADAAPQAERAERATRGMHMLLQLVGGHAR